MNIKRIEELVLLMTENELTELEVEEEGTKVRLIRKHGVLEQQIMSSPAMHVVQAGPEMQASEKTKEKDTRGLSEIKSPMVGTFYKAPSPEAEAYVKVGDIVHKGDVVCIVEAMKLMNEVKSEFDGKIVDILPDNAESVEFGQVLFHIEPL